MALNPGGTGNYRWAYTEGELELWGTVLAIQEVQAREYNPNNNQPGRPRTWPDGNPVLNIRMALADPSGQIKTVTFPEAGKKQQSGEKPSLHMDLYKLSNGGMSNLIGKTLHLWTWPANPTTNQPWGQGNPRQFGCELVDGYIYELAPGTFLPDEFNVPVLLCNDGAHGGQPTPAAPQQIQAPVVAQGYPQSQMQPQMQPQPQIQPQPMMQQPAMQPQPMAQPQQQVPAVQAMPPQPANGAQMPQGMDPAVAAAMQAVGAVNVQPVADTTGGVYDQGIPF